MLPVSPSRCRDRRRPDSRPVPLPSRRRHEAATSQAEHWHREWLRLTELAWAEGTEEAESLAADCQARQQPFAARAAAIHEALESGQEAAAATMLSLRITEQRLAEALSAAAAAQAAEAAERMAQRRRQSAESASEAAAEEEEAAEEEGKEDV